MGPVCTVMFGFDIAVVVLRPEHFLSSVSSQAKDCGQQENKWLMINIQNVQDFACQCLNRDVWSNEAVKTIIREHFIFWQVWHVCPKAGVQPSPISLCPFLGC